MPPKQITPQPQQSIIAKSPVIQPRPLPNNGKKYIYGGCALPFVSLLVGMSVFIYLRSSVTNQSGNSAIDSINKFLFALPIIGVLAAPVLIIYGLYIQSNYKKSIAIAPGTEDTTPATVSPENHIPPQNPYV